MSLTIGAGNPVTLGTVNGDPVIVNSTYAGDQMWTPTTVTLTADYLRDQAPSGWPFPPGMTGTAAPDLEFPKTLPAGTTLAFAAIEAAALIALGAATNV
ncbi:MAG: hypothetical protein WDN69_30745 [Aliidongia sp.]